MGFIFPELKSECNNLIWLEDSSNPHSMNNEFEQQQNSIAESVHISFKLLVFKLEH